MSVRVRLKQAASFPHPHGPGMIGIPAGDLGQCRKATDGGEAWYVRFDFDPSLRFRFTKDEMRKHFERIDSTMGAPHGEVDRAAGKPVNQKRIPELPPECRRDEFGFSRAGVDFQAITRAISEAKGGVKP